MGRDKAVIEIGGSSLISRVAKALSDASLEPIRIAVSNPEDVDHYGRTIDDEIEIEWVVDAEPHAGPIEAIIEPHSTMVAILPRYSFRLLTFPGLPPSYSCH